MIQLYAITRHPAPALPERLPLRALAIGDLAAVCATADDCEVSPAALWRHEEVVETLMDDRDVLPVRYGTRFDDEAAAARAIELRRGELAEALERVRGAVELSLRVAAAGEPETGEQDRSDMSGADYLRLKIRSAASAERVVRTVHEPLSCLSRASVRRPPRERGELLRAAYLVERGAVGRFTEAVAGLEAAHPGLRMLCTGPWPPYSFAEP